MNTKLYPVDTFANCVSCHEDNRVTRGLCDSCLKRLPVLRHQGEIVVLARFLDGTVVLRNQEVRLRSVWEPKPDAYVWFTKNTGIRTLADIERWSEVELKRIVLPQSPCYAILRGIMQRFQVSFRTV